MDDCLWVPNSPSPTTAGLTSAWPKGSGHANRGAGGAGQRDGAVSSWISAGWGAGGWGHLAGSLGGCPRLPGSHLCRPGSGLGLSPFVGGLTDTAHFFLAPSPWPWGSQVLCVFTGFTSEFSHLPGGSQPVQIIGCARLFGCLSLESTYK